MKRKTIFTFKMSFMLLIGWFGINKHIQAEESVLPLTHLEFLAELADSVWEDCLDEWDLGREHLLIIEEPDPEIGLAGWAISRLEKKCRERGLRTVTLPDTLRPDSILILKPDLLNFSLFYPEWGRAGFFGRRWIERQGILHADIQCRDSSGSILFHKSIRSEKRDRIFADQLVYLEQNVNSPHFPARPEFHDFLSRTETWVMIGSMTAVLYLFYIIRS